MARRHLHGRDGWLSQKAVPFREAGENDRRCLRRSPACPIATNACALSSAKTEEQMDQLGARGALPLAID